MALSTALAGICTLIPLTSYAARTELRGAKPQANQGRRVAQLAVNDLRKTGELQLAKVGNAVVNAFLALGRILRAVRSARWWLRS